jgi:hypothetical protein
LAKKSRTPTPPRKVQAPQRREHSRAQRAARAPEDRQRLFLYVFAAAGVIGVIIAIIVVLAGRGTGSNAPGRIGVQVPNLATLPGVQQGPPPWLPREAGLQARSQALGIPLLTQEALQVHYHAHLDIFDDGQAIPVPPGIGISQKQGLISVLHTHDAGGYIHVEAPQAYDYTLGQFFGVWGLLLNRKCIGGLCAKPGKPLQVWVNGHPFRADPTRLILEDHQEIVIAYGRAPEKIPKTFDFSPVG